MESRRVLIVFALTLLGSTGLGAQTRVRTETITPPPAAAAPAPSTPSPAAPAPPLNPLLAPAPLAPAPAPVGQAEPGAHGEPPVRVPPAAKPRDRALARASVAVVSDVLTDLSQLPAPVARMRERILAAARTGELDKVFTVMQSNETMPIFSFGNEPDPLAFWRANYPDSGGVEVLAILIDILETGFVHVDAGTPRDMYVWPYFAYLPLKQLTPIQKVELFKIVTGSDYREMQEYGAYIFYRVGIGPDGTWHFFVSGD